MLASCASGSAWAVAGRRPFVAREAAGGLATQVESRGSVASPASYVPVQHGACGKAVSLQARVVMVHHWAACGKERLCVEPIALGSSFSSHHRMRISDPYGGTPVRCGYGLCSCRPGRHEIVGHAENRWQFKRIGHFVHNA
jgi:hypothetical protein